MHTIVRTMTIAAALPALLLVAPSTGTTQQPSAQRPGADARWLAWVGCWQPAEGPGPAAVCVLPAGGAAVELVTVAEGAVQARERLDASGARVPGRRERCDGWDEARWSPDGRRVYLRSEHACDGAAVRATGVIAMHAPGEWMDARGVRLADGPASVRVRRYRALGDESVLPAALAAEVRAAVAARATTRSAAQASAAAPIGAGQVIEAARAVDAAVVEAWLVERGRGFDLDARTLVALDEARVPDRVVDVMVALSYPGKFAIARPGATRGDTTIRMPSPGTGTSALDNPVRIGGLGLGGVNRYGPGGACLEDWAFSAYCSAYSPYGWGASGWGGAGWGGAQGPVIVVRDPARRDANGRVVKGKGYTRGESSSEGTASPRGDRATTTRSGGSRGSDAGRTRESSGGSETRRKAKPRDP